MIPPDFWWLDNNLNVHVLEVRVAESPPIGPDDSPGLTHVEEAILLSSLTVWISSHSRRNLHRSIDVYERGQVVSGGPLVIDIDGDLMEGGTQADAWPVAVQAVRCLRNNGFADDDMRLLDSGQKGYNIELRPTVRLGGRALDHAGLRLALVEALRKANNVEGGTLGQVAPGVLIDPWHPYVRIWNTPNVWLDSDGRYHEQLKREIALSEVV